MGSKDDLQMINIQLDIQDNENITAQIIEWSKQVSARLKEIQRQVDKLNKWIFPV